MSGFDYPPSAHAAKSSLTATKITYKNPLNPDLYSESDPETSVEICRKSTQKRPEILAIARVLRQFFEFSNHLITAKIP